jgi:hypothetical protein
MVAVRITVFLIFVGRASADLTFAFALEECIRNHAHKLAETFPQWGDKCDAVTSKVDFQAKVYEETLTPIYEAWGYPAALWCAMYSLGMVPVRCPSFKLENLTAHSRRMLPLC